MGCVASKLEEEEVVSICRERKRLMKLAVQRRYALAESHFRYFQALCAVSASIDLFVARHKAPSNPYMITFSPPQAPDTSESCSSVVNNTMFLQQRPCEATKEAIGCVSCGSSTTSESSNNTVEEGEEGEGKSGDRVETEQREFGEYYYMQMQMQMASPQREFGWDFFNPFFGMSNEVISGYNRPNCDDDELRRVREQEGIPELEEEVVDRGEAEEDNKNQNKVVVVGVDENLCKESKKECLSEAVKSMVCSDSMSHVEEKGLGVMEIPEGGRELLEALRDIEDYFIKAYDSGKDVSRMLEANRLHLPSSMEEIKDNSTRFIHAITWHRSTSSKSTSCKSLMASSSKSSSTWTEYKNELFDDFGGMVSGSHSLTLERLYAWEKKLYHEVKAGDDVRKLYERKCMRLKNQDVRGDDALTMDKTRAAVKDLYARILVAIRSAESISEMIEKLRDEELQPQIIELLKGLTQSWKIMLEAHETQKKIIFEVGTFACPTYGKFCNDSHRLATHQVFVELQCWRECFMDYVTAQRAYVEALHGWLAKFLAPEVEFSSRSRSSAAPYRANGPPLLPICYSWLTSLEALPHRSVVFALKSFAKDVRALWVQQGKEQQQKRKVDGLAKELEKKNYSFHNTDSQFLELKLIEDKDRSEQNDNHKDYLYEKKDHLDFVRRKLDLEKEKHHNCMQETKRTTLNGFQTGFSSVFESLSEFSKASQKMYNDLVIFFGNGEKAAHLSYLEGSQPQVDEEIIDNVEKSHNH